MIMHKRFINSSLIAVFFACYCLNSAATDVKPELQIATYRSFISEWGPGAKLKALFEQECNCTLVFNPAPEGAALLNQIRLKKQHFKADVVFGLDTSLTLQALETGFFQPHQLQTAALQSTLSQTPIAMNDTFVPIDKGYFTFIYNQKRLKNPPKSFAELIKRPEIIVTYPDPRVSTVGRGLLLWINKLYPNQTQPVWKALSKQALTVTPGWSENYGLMLEGEVDMALSYHTSPVYHQMVEKTSDYSAALFNEGHYAQIEVAAISRRTSVFPLAQQFIQFLISPEAQKIIALNNWMAPANLINIDPTFDALPVPKGLPLLAPEQIKTNYKKWISEWLINSR
jgi:thiamine transport system substrate-binding protein